ncbi:MAG TPA: hypothetical protein VFJ57_15035 [Solirubrobacterales bacterium]|nr:hypothetical protein [Solirubrobacterales bacterium]
MRRARLRPKALAAALACIALLAAPAAAEVTQKNGLIVSFGGSISPRSLPRTGVAPIGVTVDGRIRTASGRLPPALRRIVLEINRNGVLEDRGLARCRVDQIQPSSSGKALAACGPAQVGSGRVAGQIVVPEQRPFAFRGRIIAFNGRRAGGGRAILAHVYTSSPFSLSVVLTFSLARTPGTFGTRLVAVIPRKTRRLLHITAFRLHLGRSYSDGGRRRSYLSAGCPAPAGFPGTTFPLVRAGYSFVGGTTIRNVIVRTCHARP